MSLDIMNAKKVKWAKLSILSNTSLIGLKVLVFFITGSISVLSEAIHSGMDLLAAIIAFFSVKKASQPADDCHPFGHGKYENLSGLIESVLIIAAAFFIIKEAVPKLINGNEIEEINWAILVMLLSAAVNFFVARKLFKVAKETDSIALETDVAHLAVDVYTCLGVMAGLIAIRFTGITILDPIISILVALYIAWIGIHLSYKSTKDLLDQGMEKRDVELIEKIIVDHLGQIKSYHKLATRKSGSTVMIDVHLQFHADLPVKEAHDVSHHIQEDIKVYYPNSRISIHIEPCSTNCQNCGYSDCETINAQSV